MGDLNSTNAFTNVNTDNTNNSVAVQGGNAAAQYGSSAVSLSGGSGSNFTLSMQSPEAIAALSAGTKEAFDKISSTALGSLAFAQRVNKDALDLVEKNSESPLQQSGRILIPLVFLLVIGAALYFSKRG